MNMFKNFLLLSTVVFCSSVPGNNETGSKKIMPDPIAHGAQVLLVYTGSLAGAKNFNVGIHIIMDTSIGFRYDVAFENGAAVMSHVAIFYKFSNPTQTVTYNYRTHTSTVNNCCKSSDRDPQLSIVGQETVDSFSCTHLQHTSTSTNFTEVADYWVSTKLPGFQQLASVLNSLKSTVPIMPIDKTVFKWGGLVKMMTTYSDQKHGTQQSTLQLREANTDIQLRASDFDVPTN
jgi:hypothetical protein